MKRKRQAWKAKDMDYLREHHKDLEPYEIAANLGMAENRVRLKLSVLGLKTKGAIQRELKDLEILSMIKEGVEPKEITRLTGADANKIRLMRQTIKIESEPKPIKPVPKILKKIERYKPDFEETGEYRYSDLSISEKIIYHQI